MIHLINLAQKGVMVIMGDDSQPDQSHRNMIADYLLLRGIDVSHLLNAKESENHNLSPQARRESSELIYDRQVTAISR